MDRFLTYNNDHCWQYDIRLNNYSQDLIEAGLTKEESSALRVGDFDFEFVRKEDNDVCVEIRDFIERHEWLGKLGPYPTHRFTARYKGILAGVIVMDMPIAFSKILGDDTRKIEKLISRGACISWSPKNLASSLLMWSINWMVKNTHRRVFTAYSDPEARELGTIYQACNFHYLGQSNGAQKKYKLPNGKWVSDRSFRSRSMYKRLAKANGIIWQDEWQIGDRIIWDNIPNDIENKIRQYPKDLQKTLEFRELPPKHKYVMIKGRTKYETKQLLKRFKEHSPKLQNLPYPKQR